MNRVVITGIGVVSPVGSTLEDFWSALVEGRSAIGPFSIARSERLQLYVRGSQRESLRTTRIMLRRLVRLYMRSQGLRLRA